MRVLTGEKNLAGPTTPVLPGVEDPKAGDMGENCGHPQNRDNSGPPLLCAVLVIPQ
jgi:hypothetical protein